MLQQCMSISHVWCSVKVAEPRLQIDVSLNNWIMLLLYILLLLLCIVTIVSVFCLFIGLGIMITFNLYYNFCVIRTVLMSQFCQVCSLSVQY